MRAASALRARRYSEPIEHTVYDGRRRLGVVRSAEHGFDAFDVDDKPLGKFNTEAAAVEELLRLRAKEATP